MKSLTGLLGWQFNSNFVMDNCREWDLTFLRIEKTFSKLFEVIGDCWLHPVSNNKRWKMGGVLQRGFTLAKSFSDNLFSPKLNLRGKMNQNFLQFSFFLLSFAYDWSYFNVCLDNMLFTKYCPWESDWLVRMTVRFKFLVGQLSRMRFIISSNWKNRFKFVPRQRRLLLSFWFNYQEMGRLF